MAEVMIDGVAYAPIVDASSPTTSESSTTATPSVGIAITTHNRPDVLKRCLDAFFQHGWPGPIVVVDDASKVPAADQLSAATNDLITMFRFDQNVGIARAKNKCIELLRAMDCEHLFLFDDDCWPAAGDWWKPYVEHREPHLCHLFKDRGPRGTVLGTPRTTYTDHTMWAQEHPRGCMVYLESSVVDRVGGFRPEFGRWGHEHVEYSERIHNAGLTLQPFQDVRDSELLIYSMDADWHNHPKFERSVDDRTRKASLAANDLLMQQFRGSTDYVEYRQVPNVVLTTCLTAVADPQPSRKGVAKLAPKDFEAWQESIAGAVTVVLHDIPEGNRGLPVPSPHGWCRVPSGMNPYVQRWCAYYQHLRQHPYQWVWCTDGTDVVMQREPWAEMAPGTLYVGYEPTVVGTPWLAQNHKPYREWIDAHGGYTLLNAGVVGGDHATMLEFTHAMAAECLRVDHTGLAGDMAALQVVCRSDRWADRIVSGPIVTTLFKQNEKNDYSYWRHK